MKILLAIDDSTYSKAATEAVASRPWPQGTVVRVLSAVEHIVPPASTLWYDAGGSMERAQEQLTARATQLTTEAAQRLESAGLTVDTAVRQGDPRAVVVDEAKDWSADLIVVGSHGYTGIKRLLLGSVAQSVVSHAPCSVEVVRPKDDQAD